jgi:hypothetical protein
VLGEQSDGARYAGEGCEHVGVVQGGAVAFAGGSGLGGELGQVGQEFIPSGDLEGEASVGAASVLVAVASVVPTAAEAVIRAVAVTRLRWSMPVVPQEE